jgi:hypothetical protein
MKVESLKVRVENVLGDSNAASAVKFVYESITAHVDLNLAEETMVTGFS